MRFCSNCGKELSEHALFCSSCGCKAENNINADNYQHTSEFAKVQLYQTKINTLHTISIVALVLCLGIGIVFSIIGWFYMIKNKLLSCPVLENPSIADKTALEIVLTKRKRAEIFLLIPFYVLIICLLIVALLQIIGR